MQLDWTILRSGEQIMYRLRGLYERYGYRRFKMSKFEEYDLYVRNKDFLVSDRMITFTDARGILMALKPDVTLSIIKNTRAEEAGPRKVYYNESVYRSGQGEETFQEIMQTGLECIGELDLYHIYEVIALAVESLRTIHPDYVLDVSHMGLVSGFMEAAGVTEAEYPEVMTAVRAKNLAGLEDFCRRRGLSGTVQALLERAPERFQEVFILKGREDKRLLPLIHALESQGVVIQLANRQYLDEKSDGAVHQGIIARVKPGRQYQENDLPDLIASLDQPFLLILDGVTDPHNLGACLRSADAAGVHAVIVPKDRSAQLNATAKKVACGAAESVPLIRVTNLARTMRMLQEENIWIVGTAGEADHTLYQSKMTGRLALVMGAEGEGMRRLTREHCDELISIPMAGRGSSLNVSVATGICLFDAVRQRS